MESRVHLFSAVLLLLAGTIAFIWFLGGDRELPSGPGHAPRSEMAHERSTAPESNEKGSEQRTEIGSSSSREKTPATGRLVVLVTCRDTDEPAADVGVIVTPQGAQDPLLVEQVVRTNPAGVAVLGDLPPAHFHVRCDRSSTKRVSAKITSRKTVEIRLELTGELTLEGTVVDKHGGPVANAGLLLDSTRYPVAHTDENGGFRIRGARRSDLIGARAPGFSPSMMLLYDADEDALVEKIRIVLSAAGGAVEGSVVDPAGRPVARAVVRVGAERRRRPMTRRDGCLVMPPAPRDARTDARGRFVASGLMLGKHPIAVRAAGLAPWSGTCEVTEAGATRMWIHLQDSVSCDGVVQDASRELAKNVLVSVGRRGHLDYSKTVTAEDGSYTLRDLGTGALAFEIVDTDRGAAFTNLQGTAGERLHWSPVLAHGIVLRGRVISHEGAPILRASVFVSVSSLEDQAKKFRKRVMTDGRGEFRILNCPPSALLRVIVYAPAWTPAVRADVDPRAGEMLLRLSPRPRSSAHVSGVIETPAGEPLSGVRVQAITHPDFSSATGRTDSEGRFTLGPLAPCSCEFRATPKGYPTVVLRDNTLQADQTLDLGRVRMLVGGHLGVRIVRGGLPVSTKVHLRVYDKDHHPLIGVDTGMSEIRSAPLAPGRYFLFPHGDGAGIAAQWLPFTIKSGELTTLDLTLAPGRVRAIRITVPPGEESITQVRLTIKNQDNRVVMDSWLGRDPGQPCTTAACLAPGDYVVTARTRAGHSATAGWKVAKTGVGPRLELALSRVK